MTYDNVISRLLMLRDRMDKDEQYYCESWESMHDADCLFNVKTINAWIETVKSNRTHKILPKLFMNVANDIWRQT